MEIGGINVEIIVSEPWEWNYGNLYGMIVSQSSNTILIQLTAKIEGKQIKSDLLELRPRYEKATFDELTSKNSVSIGGALIDRVDNAKEYVFTGSVKVLEGHVR